MSNGFLDTLRDETLRIEVGSAASSDLAGENLDLSTATLSRTVREAVIVRRAERPVTTGLSHNRLLMHEVMLPPFGRAELEPCAA